ncbi:MAG: hypothetical protein HZA22_05525 [Nitrospirae bacterium]|nr:hypothetical protein [Nitrospirota bacterium]
MKYILIVLVFILLSINCALADDGQRTIESLLSQNDQLELQIQHIQANITSINNKLPEMTAESSASRKLLEISEKNLAAPNWVLGMLVSVIALLVASAALWGIIIKRDLQQKIDGIKKLQDEIQGEHYPIIAAQRDREAIQEWESGRYLLAIENEQEAISFLKRVNGNGKHDYPLAKYSSNLAYFYAEANRSDKIGEAIELVTRGLEAGKRHDNLDLVDNYLYVIMKMSNHPEDRKKWTEIYDVYGSKIAEQEIRESTEVEEFRRFYDECIRLFPRK